MLYGFSKLVPFVNTYWNAVNSHILQYQGPISYSRFSTFLSHWLLYNQYESLRTKNRFRATRMMQVPVLANSVHSPYSGYTFSHYELPVSYSRLYSVREVWFVSTCHSHQGNSCAHLTSISHRIRSFVLFGVDTTFQWVKFDIASARITLLSRHCKAISTAANQKPFCK